MSPRRRTRCAIRLGRLAGRRTGWPPRRAVARSAVPGLWGRPNEVPALPVSAPGRSAPARLGSTVGAARRRLAGSAGHPPAGVVPRPARTAVGAVTAARPASSVGLQPLAEASNRPLAGAVRTVARWSADGVASNSPAVARRRVGLAASQVWVRPSADRAVPARPRKLSAERAPPEGLGSVPRWRRLATWVWRVRVPLEAFVGVRPAVAAPTVRRQAACHRRRAASRRGSPATGSGRTAPTGHPTRSPGRPGPDRTSARGAARPAPWGVGRGSRGLRVPLGGSPRARRARRWRRGCSCGGPRAGCRAPPLPRRVRRRGRASTDRSAPSVAHPPRTPPPAPGARRAGRPPPGAAVPAGARCAAPRDGRHRRALERIRRPPRAVAGRR